MVLKIPQYHSFPQSLTRKVLEGTGCQLVPDWEISVPRRDDIAWSVVLSYLISANYRTAPDSKKPEDFARRLRELTGSDENLKLVIKSIRSFNPFRNRYSCFFSETLRQVVKEFKKNLSWSDLPRVSDKLSAVSTKLHCPVVYIWKNEKDTKSRIYSENADKCLGLITLYSCDFPGEEKEKTETVYHFLIDHELGFIMKNAALRYFLKEVKMRKKEIRKIEQIVKKSKHFLISLLNNGCQKVIPKLYKSSYIVSKLAEATYETDPRTTDSEGLSALYHALVLGNVKTLHVLYYFAANNCFQSECSYRNPDCCIVNNLLKMEEIFLSDLAKSDDFRHHPNYNDLKTTSDELLRLNKFLKEVNSKIIKIKNRLNYYETNDETVFEACKRRDVIVSVLDTYQEFFKPAQHESTNVSPLDDYVMFKNYYNLIDMATAIIFFDNIVFLKERLVLEDTSQFSAIETSFLFSVINHVAFDKIDVQNLSKNVHPLIEANMDSLYIFPLVRRLENMNRIKEFSKNLQDTIINKHNVVKLIPRREIYAILNSYPIFKDGIHINRLTRCLKTALRTKVTDVKSVLVIERVLQVIGEYIIPEENNDYSFRRYLSIILPKDVLRVLRRTRHELSHLKSYVFMAKAACETNFSLFRSIQKELRIIQYHFKPVFLTYTLRVYIVLIKLLEEQLEHIRKLPHLYASSALNPFYLRAEISAFLKALRFILFQTYSSSCKEMFETVLQSAENVVLKEINWSGDFENVKNTILYELWPLKYLVELQHSCRDGRAATVLEEFEKLENPNQNTDFINYLEDTTSNLLSMCKDLNSEIIPNTYPKRMTSSWKNISNIEHFLKILKGFIYLSEEEKDKIRNDIPEAVKQSLTVKERLIKSIEEGFSLNLDKRNPEFKILYLSNKKMDKFFELYRSKSTQALSILQTPDPITELEEIFLKNSVDKKKYDALCKAMQFSVQTTKVLRKLVAGQREKIPGNNLSNLLNRVKLLKKILIEENEEIFNLWLKVKGQTSRQYVVDTVVWYYLRDHRLQAAVEMLLFDCMSIFENEKQIENPWIKSSKLYCGINLRNVLSHGSPLLEILCKFLDPEDLPSEMIQKILRLIEGEDAIEAILELYQQVHEDFSRLAEIINSKEKDEYFVLKKRILKCDEWKNYSLLLPCSRKPSKNTA